MLGSGETTFLGNVVAPNITTLTDKTQYMTNYTNLTSFTGAVGINSTSMAPGCLFDIGGSVGVAGSMMMGVTTGDNSIKSVQYRNTSTGTSAEMRFITTCGDDGNYFAFTTPSNGNTGSFFGIPKSSGNFIFSTGGGRNMYIGPISNNSVSLCANGSPRLTVNGTGETTFTGNIVIPTLNGNKIGASDEGFGYTNDAP